MVHTAGGSGASVPVAGAPEVPVVHLLGGPHVTVTGQRLMVPEGSKRLLALVALRRGRVERSFAAGTLWPDGDEMRAARNLRSALWRMRRAGIEVIDADKWSMELAPSTVVDAHALSAWADRLIHGSPEPDDLDVGHLPDDACHLLPGWYDDWVVMARERVRQRLLHGLEALSRLLTERGRCAEAVDVAMRAVAEDPLRESAQSVLIAAHLAQDNAAAARDTYLAFACLLRRELAIEPSRQITALVADLCAGAGSRGRPVPHPGPTLRRA